MRHRSPLQTVLITLLASTTLATDKPFVTLEFDAALKRAAKEQKIVFVDFYATWCGPCKILDKTTLADEKVVNWLTENTIALKIDAERNIALSTKYRVGSYPTLLFVKPDGTELGRLQGVVPTDHFLSEAAGMRDGKTPLERARDKLNATGENDPMQRMEFARELVRAGKYDEALEHFLWCYDEGEKHSRGFHGVRSSYLLNDITRLGKLHPPATAALRERRDNARTATRNLRKPGWFTGLFARQKMPGLDFAALNRALGDDENTLELYDELARKDPRSIACEQLRLAAFDLLRKAKRYSEIADHDDLVGRGRQNIELCGYMRRSGAIQERTQAEQSYRRFTIRRLADYYEILIGAGRHEDAARLAAMTTEFDDTAETCNALAWGGFLTERPTQANLELAKTANDMTGGNSAAIVDTLARILDKLGQTDQACKQIKEIQSWLPNGPDRDIMHETAKDLRCPSTD